MEALCYSEEMVKVSYMRLGCLLGCSYLDEVGRAALDGTDRADRRL